MNIPSLRADTPGCATKAHFNNAGASLMPFRVIEAIQEYASYESVVGGYEAADNRKTEIDAFYTSMARLLGCAPRNVAFTTSATDSFVRALSSIPFKAGDTILIANEDYISNQIQFLSLQKRMGIRLIRAESLPGGGVDVDSMGRLMDAHKPKLVSLTHVPTNSGLVQPVEEVGKLCRERGILYLVDGCQSTGQMPVDMEAIGCDFFSGTFRKFLRGPRGAGFLFVSDGVLNSGLWPLYLDMRGADWKDKDVFVPRADATRFEDWEFNYSLVMGSTAAVDYSLNIGIPEIEKRNVYLGGLVRKGLQDLGLKIVDKGKKQSSIIVTAIPGKDPDAVLQALRKRNVNTSITSRSYAVIDFDAKGVRWGLRISPHYYNNEQDVALLMDGLKEII
jgi:selenocysteine lyase/cysteine desulfurase